MKAAIIRETAKGERRVAATPETVRKLAAMGVDVVVEAGAGAGAFIADADYENAGAKIASSAAEALAGADLVLKVQAPSAEELEAIPEGATVVALFAPHSYPHKRKLLARRIRAFALELIPRISRAQSMD
ncbi:MAG: NAD(P)(+) transhydrogenase (Re/Si-specific) subunit alpha, partial [Zetaproteobacteria bacterium]